MCIERTDFWPINMAESNEWNTERDWWVATVAPLNAKAATHRKLSQLSKDQHSASTSGFHHSDAWHIIADLGDE